MQKIRSRTSALGAIVRDRKIELIFHANFTRASTRKFPLRFAQFADKFFVRLLSSRNKFITFLCQRNFVFTRTVSLRNGRSGAFAMTWMCVHRTFTLEQNLHPNRTDLHPDKLIARRVVPSNCRLQREKIALSTDVDKTVRNSSGC